MTDQMIPADKVRDLHGFADKILATTADQNCTAIALANLVKETTPPPKRPTLADMPPEERAACQWMQCEVTGFQGQWVLATLCDDDDEAGLIAACGEICWSSPAQVTPRPDLPRLTWPGDQKPAPAPALPEGWRLADHPNYGRVVVTRPTPDADGNVCFVAPAASFLGNDWHLCKHDELTYIDTGQEAADAVD